MANEPNFSSFSSFMDVRLEQALGHFTELFKNGTQLSLETLGPMHGQWGSFLPAQKRPPSILISNKPSAPLKTPSQMIVSQKESNLAPKGGNAVKPNQENVQDCTNGHPDLKKDSENHSISECRSKRAMTFCKRKREDKGAGPSPKRTNLGVYSFSGLHKILPGPLPSGDSADSCAKPNTSHPNEKHAVDVAPSTPTDNKKQRVQIVTTDYTFALPEVQVMEIQKEAQDLEQRASRLKKSGQDGLSAEIYLESAIKYLHAAQILEPANWDKIKPGDAEKSMRLYIRAGKLFEYVAHIFHQWMQFVPAGLAYKGMEVAFMKAGFYKNMDMPKDNPNRQVPCQNRPRENSTLSSNIPASLPQFLDYVSVMNSAFEGTRGYEKALRDADNCAQDVPLFKEALNLDFHNVEKVLFTMRRALASSSCG